MGLLPDFVAHLGATEGRPGYLLDLMLWHEWHRSRHTLPSGWGHSTLPQIAHSLGSPAWVVVRPWRLEMQRVQVTTEEAEGQRVITYHTRAGALVARWAIGPDGDWWQTEYPVKASEDLPAASEIIAARTYIVEPPSPENLAALEVQPSQIAHAEIVALEIPMRPYSDLLHTMLGWGDGLMLLQQSQLAAQRGESRPAIQSMLEMLEAKLQGLVEQIASLPGAFIIAPDNLDGQYISPRAFREHLSASYRRTVEVLHRKGKGLVVHAGGPVKRLLPLLAEAEVDIVEGIAGPPQGDANLPEAREAVGPNLILWGGIPQDYLLAAHSQEEFEAAVVEASRQAAGDRRMILGVADRVPVDADLSRLRMIPELVARTAELMKR